MPAPGAPGTPGHRGGRSRRDTFAVRAVLVLVPAVAVLAAVAALVLAPWAVSEHREAQRYLAAPTCAERTKPGPNCTWATDASVAFVNVVKNTGRNAEGYHTDVGLTRDTAGIRLDRDVSLDGDLGAAVHVGDAVPVTVWNGSIVRYRLADLERTTSSDPCNITKRLIVWEAFLVPLAVICGRLVAWRWVGPRPWRVNVGRFELADFALLALVAATVTAAAFQAAIAVAALSMLTIGVLVLSCAVWPFVPWVRRSAD